MKIRTKAVSLLLTVLLVFGVYAIVPPAAFAEEIIEVTAETDYFTDGNTYRVSQDVTNDKRIRMQGSAVLTLDEGVTLTLNKGIQVSENNSLTIRGAGKLIANAEKNNAAIGSGESQKNGAITIESGEIIATGGEFAAGIGGGRYSQKGSAIKISGGKITATGQTCSAGIGGGTNNNWEGHYSCVGDITITGGEVTANGIGGGAGIGGGGTTFNGVKSGSYGGNVGTITIIGGKVTATGGEQGFGIGPGMNTDLVSSNIDQIILGWTQKSDFIEASSFGDDADKIAFFERQTLYIAGTARTATAENILNGCKLIPERDEKDYSLVYAEVGNVESRYYYTGADIAITPVITDYNGNVLLADDYDTVLKRGGEVVAAANELGSCTCTFEGKGDYKDSITFDFEVVTQPAPTLQATDLKESTARLCWEDESAATNWVVEYGTDDIFTEAQSITVAGTTAVTLDIGVEGQVQGNDLDTGVCLSGIVKGVAGEDVRSCSGLEGLIFRITGKVFLQLPYTGHILHELVGLRQVLQQDVGLIGALDAKKLVVSDLVWTDDKVHLAVVHIQPGKCTLVIVVRLEGLDFFQEIFPHAGLDGDIGSNFQGILDLFDIGLVSVVIPYGFQGAVGGAADECIWTVLVRIVPGFELLHRHVGRIETGSGRTVSIAFHE